MVAYSEQKIMNFYRLEDLQTYICVIYDLKLVWQSKQHFIFYRILRIWTKNVTVWAVGEI
jgi:hypothetical protein